MHVESEGRVAALDDAHCASHHVVGFKSAFLRFHIDQGFLRRVVAELDRFHADGTIAPPISQPPSGVGTPHPSRAVPLGLSR